jgi:hypothetical protein
MLTVTMLAISPAQAYVGPGLGLTAIGSLLALFAAIGLAIVGFVWYPLRRLMGRRKTAVPAGQVDAAVPAEPALEKQHGDETDQAR